MLGALALGGDFDPKDASTSHHSVDAPDTAAEWALPIGPEDDEGEAVAPKKTMKTMEVVFQRQMKKQEAQVHDRLEAATAVACRFTEKRLL